MRVILHAFFFFIIINYFKFKIFYFFFSHGTRCAGASSGKANNGMCGVGVAYNSNIAGKKKIFNNSMIIFRFQLGIRLLDGRITTLLEARALTLFAVNVSIKSASWG